VTVLQEDGKVISNAPKKEIPKIIKIRKKKILTIQLVAMAFKAFPPSVNEIKAPKTVKINIMDNEYVSAFFIPRFFGLCFALKRKLTVMGKHRKIRRE
jgi:hypothetical protein